VWPKNVLRHTFASMHYAMHQDESLLKAQMGHWERTSTLHRHYRALKTKAEAAKFWALHP
jgi:integrase